MYISHSSKIPGQPRDEQQWEEEEEIMPQGQKWPLPGSHIYIGLQKMYCLKPLGLEP